MDGNKYLQVASMINNVFLANESEKNGSIQVIEHISPSQ